VNGLLYGGGADQLGKQAIGAFAVLGYSLVIAGIIALVMRATMGIRVSEDEEVSGVDLGEHAESAYVLGESGGGGVFAGIGHHAAAHRTEA
jgi:Amt family ammonium transporter